MKYLQDNKQSGIFSFTNNVVSSPNTAFRLLTCHDFLHLILLTFYDVNNYVVMRQILKVVDPCGLNVLVYVV